MRISPKAEWAYQYAEEQKNLERRAIREFLKRHGSRNKSMRSISEQPSEKTCRLMSVSRPLYIRCVTTRALSA